MAERLPFSFILRDKLLRFPEALTDSTGLVGQGPSSARSAVEFGRAGGLVDACVCSRSHQRSHAPKSQTNEPGPHREPQVALVLHHRRRRRRFPTCRARLPAAAAMSYLWVDPKCCDACHGGCECGYDSSYCGGDFLQARAEGRPGMVLLARCLRRAWRSGQPISPTCCTFWPRQLPHHSAPPLHGRPLLAPAPEDCGK